MLHFSKIQTDPIKKNYLLFIRAKIKYTYDKTRTQKALQEKKIFLTSIKLGKTTFDSTKKNVWNILLLRERNVSEKLI